MEATGNPALDAVLMWGGVITVLAGVAALLWRAVSAVIRLARRVDEFMDDWAGEPGRPGVPPRPGVMERVATIDERLTRVEHELYPNSGGSLRDAVDQANERLVRLCPDPDACDPPGSPPAPPAPQ
ncbi:hypothetical protein [Actinacidiphila reveromycinica]|uniref:hypothetical protein n=1 Tax=Actinacidiphila reveromycinica TaxID=659352 RepID=UPI001F3B2F19|nr:hypothetical protein [Streptomyces sp. SN-593]